MTRKSAENPERGGYSSRKGRSPRGFKPQNDFSWGEVDDVQQQEESLLLPVKKQKKRRNRIEKIESTLTVENPQADLYAHKPIKRRHPEVPISDDLALPSYGKHLELENTDDEFSIFLRRAEEADRKEREPKPPKRERKKAPRRDKSRMTAENEAAAPGTDSSASAEKPALIPTEEADLRLESLLASIRAKAAGKLHRFGFSNEWIQSRVPRRHSVEGAVQLLGELLEADLRLVDSSRAGGRTEPLPAENLGKAEKTSSAQEPASEIQNIPADESRSSGTKRSGKKRASRPAAEKNSESFADDTPIESPEPKKRESAPARNRPEWMDAYDMYEIASPVSDEAAEPEVPEKPAFDEPVSEEKPDRQSGKRKKSSAKKRGEQSAEPVEEPTAEKRTESEVVPPVKEKRQKKSRSNTSGSASAAVSAAVPESEKGLASEDKAENPADFTFGSFPLSAPMLEMLREASYMAPTPIQAGTIPRIFAGVDILGQSKTGSGKTAAFMIPIIERVETCEPGNDPVALIVVPTRELAVQIKDETVKLSRNREIITVACYGGKPIVDQIKKMSGGVDIVIGTPGRILDLVKRHALSLDRLRWVVLDEADRMLDIGFRPDIERILKITPKNRQTLLFSATLPDPVVRLAMRYMNDPETYDFSEKDISAETIEQYYMTVDRERKYEALTRLLDREQPTQAIVFCRTKRMVDKLGKGLSNEYKSVAAIHGDLAQTQRDRIMRDFRAGKIRILVATDVVGRGIDVSGISHIINYDIPQFCDDYVHRVGRTGRMGREGVAFTLVTSQEGPELTRVEMRINRLLKRFELEGFEAFSRPDQTENEEPKEQKTVFGKPTRRIRRAL